MSGWRMSGWRMSGALSSGCVSGLVLKRVQDQASGKAPSNRCLKPAATALVSKPFFPSGVVQTARRR